MSAHTAPGPRGVPEEGARPARHQGLGGSRRRGPGRSCPMGSCRLRGSVLGEEEALERELSCRRCSLLVALQASGLVSQLCSLRSPGAGVAFPGCLSPHLPQDHRSCLCGRVVSPGPCDG